jgi:hypothetical protein
MPTPNFSTPVSGFLPLALSPLGLLLVVVFAMFTLLKTSSWLVALTVPIAVATHVQYVSAGQDPKTAILEFHPDTLFISDLSTPDSIWILNVGEAELLIDSVKTAKQYSWDVNVVAPEDTFWVQIQSYDYDEKLYEHFPIKIPPSDSALFIFLRPDLCPICGPNLQFTPFEDSLYFFSNDSVHSPSILFAHGEGVSDVSDRQVIFDETFRLKQNYPNPFNPITTIAFVVVKTGRVQISIYDLKGQQIRKLADEVFASGEHSIVWDGRNQNGQVVTSGLYFCSLTAEGVSLSKRLLLLQ